MATVPALRGQTVAPGGAQTPSFNPDVSPEAFGGGIAAAAGRLGQALDQHHEMLTAHAITMQGLQNKADSDAASVDAANKMNEIVTDYTENQQGGNALPNLKDYTDKLEDARKTAGANLNPMATRMFEGDTRRMYSNLVGSMSRHAAQQNRVYTLNTSNSKIETAANLAVANADDPVYAGLAHAVIQHETEFQAQYQGLDDVSAKAMLAQRTSKLYSSIIEQKANDSPPEAAAYFDKVKDQMIGADIKVMDNYIHRTMQPYIATQIADGIANGHTSGVHAPLVAVQANPSQFFSSIAGGPVTVTSTVRTDEHNKAVGGVPTSEHLARNGYAVDMVPPAGMTTAQLKTKLQAAGLGAHQILNEGDHVHVGWAKGSSPQTDSIMSASTLEELESRREAGIKAVDAQVDRYYNGDPTIKAAAEVKFDSTYGRRYAALKASQDGSRDRIVDALLEPGITSQEQLFKSYKGAQNDFLAMSPTTQRAVNNQLKANANPALRDMTYDQRTTWVQLDGESKSSPANFANRDLMNDPQTASLPFSVLKGLIARQNDIKAGKGIDANESRVIKWAQPWLKEAEIAPTDPDYNPLISALTENARAYYEINKKYPDQLWAQGMVTRLLADATHGGGKNFETPGAQGLVPGVPNAFTTAAIAQAKARGLKLTNEQVQQLYARNSGGR